MKKFLSIICALVFVLSLTGCDVSFEPKSNSFPLENEKGFQQKVESYASAFNDLNDEDLDEAIKSIDVNAEYGQETVDMIESYKASKEEIGKFVSCGDFEYFDGDEEGQYLAEVVSKYEKRDCKIKCTFIKNDETGEAALIKMSFEPVYSLGETLQKAAMNTALGMGTVFIVLILIAFIISGFGIIYKIQNAAENKAKAKIAAENAEKIKNVPKKDVAVSENLVDDCEIVAVITAAIAAFEGDAKPEGFVVRSIRKIR